MQPQVNPSILIWSICGWGGRHTGRTSSLACFWLLVVTDPVSRAPLKVFPVLLFPLEN